MQGGKPATAAQRRRMENLSRTGCRACNTPTKYAASGMPLQVHHLKDYSQRRPEGHDATICLCSWHHQGHAPFGWTMKECREAFGPTLIDGSRPFKDEFGTDDELLAIQNDLLSKLPKGK
jgi:hypothetical protein